MARVGVALGHLAQPAPRGQLPGTPSAPCPDSPDEIDRWLTKAATGFAVEVVGIDVTYADLDDLLHHAGPALIQIPGGPGQEGGVLALQRGGRRWLRCIAPDVRARLVQTEVVRAALVGRLEAGEAGTLDAVLSEAGLSGRRREAAVDALLEESLSGRRLRAGWLVRPAPGAGLARQMTEVGVWRALAVAVTAQLAAQGLMVGSWFALGELTLLGHFEWAWLDAWALLLLSAVPFLLLAVWAEGLISLRLGTLFKRRLLEGILKLAPEDVRLRGSGQFMGMAMEADVLELVSLAGGVTAVLAVLRLGAALVVLALAGAAGLPAAILLVCWTALAVGLGHRVWRRAEAWAAAYRHLTNDLVERMTGHRTRLAQENPERWHADEDRRLATYWQEGLGLDRLAAWLEGGLARGWMLAGLLGILVFVLLAPPGTGGLETVLPLALCLLAVLLAYQAFVLMAQAVPSLIQLAVAWREVKPLLQAAARPDPIEPLRATPVGAGTDAGTAEAGTAPIWPVLTARRLVYAYPGRQRRILDRVDLDLAKAERVLLEGPSGGGKSTLAALLSGLREADSGALLLEGADRDELGRLDWRRRVLLVPQFHENHVFTGTFAFNLLMGRGWPPTPRDLAEAGAACRALGLGPLLARMPAGFQQMVGESGWILSHGERSRLFVARALLQRPDVLILDESFAALDPENLDRALETVLRRAPALMVIAHP